MSLITVMILGIGLSMDAFAVSISKGLAMRKITWKECLSAGLWFGIFQGLMPAAGYFLGDLIVMYLKSFSGWIGFAILSLIGANMIREGFKNEENPETASMKPATMFLLAVATSIDALAVGITFSMVPVTILPSFSQTANTMIACLIITLETGILSASGVKIGELFGSKFKNKAQIAGGLILILIGLRLVLDSYGIL